jgi:hypothetical protein
MKTPTIDIEKKVDELLVCLDNDMQNIEINLSYLNQIRALVIKRDDAGLEKLLENIHIRTDRLVKNQSSRQLLRKALASSLGCSFEQVTLSLLETSVSQEKKAQLIHKKRQLRTLTDRLKQEYASTAFLLSECARFNSLLLKNIFALDRAAIVYNASGITKRQTDPAFVNVRF